MSKFIYDLIPNYRPNYSIARYYKVKTLVVLILSASWILGGVLWYYAGYSGNNLQKDGYINTMIKNTRKIKRS